LVGSGIHGGEGDDKRGMDKKEEEKKTRSGEDKPVAGIEPEASQKTPNLIPSRKKEKGEPSSLHHPIARRRLLLHGIHDTLKRTGGMIKRRNWKYGRSLESHLRREENSDIGLALLQSV